ncbi:MAG: hypothetical protein JWQ70_2916 [Aeromicrobium sp.]|nr:hypothetical protein [Aeromicrobium sp.]
MDYTPVSAHRVLFAFAATVFVALMPLLFTVLQSMPTGFLVDPHGGYRGVILGVETVAVSIALLVLLVAAIALGRRVIRGPFRV